MKILAVCGNGLGSSMILKLKILSVLKELGIDGIEVEHCDLTSASGEKADVIVITKDLASHFADAKNIISLASIMSAGELKDKLERLLDSRTVTA